MAETKRVSRPSHWPKDRWAKMDTTQRLAVVLVCRARTAGWTLEDMATHLGVSFASVSRWERGMAAPYRNTAARLLPDLEALTA